MPRSLFLDFGVKTLGIPANHLVNTVAFDQYFEDHSGQADDLFKARVLAFALNTWRSHASGLKAYLAFCADRELSPFEVSPSMLNLFLLHCAQGGKTEQTVKRYLDSIGFLSRFYMVNNPADHVSVDIMRKFVSKHCCHVDRRKHAFGSAEVRKIWDDLDSQGGVGGLDMLKFRTFMIAVFQHTTFCRYSEVKKLRLDDVIHDTDCFRIHVGFSKTDQAGRGQWVLMPKSCSENRDPHMLMCLYLHKLCADRSLNSTVQPLYLFPPLR